MKKIVKLIFFYATICNLVFAQNTSTTFFEKGPDSTIRFYFDRDYFLVDKDCEFKFFERVGHFDISSNKFNGEFRDFDLYGRTILSGSYNQGIKEGNFKAYYPDGTLKWETTYINNVPQGIIKYYYPDGKPMLELIHNGNNTFISQFWNKEGKQEIINGKGRLEITLPIIGFTEHGYTKYSLSGNVNNGQQQGWWYTSFITEDKKPRKIPFLITSYEDGIQQQKRIDDFFEGMFIETNTLGYIPTDLFPNAEILQSKNCTFDEHTGFNNFIAQKFTNFLKHEGAHSTKDEQIRLSYTVRVEKNGIPYSATIEKTSRILSSTEKTLFDAMINEISYYLPSYSENKTIRDKLTISLEINTNGDIITIPPVEIKREKGF